MNISVGRKAETGIEMISYIAERGIVEWRAQEEARQIVFRNEEEARRFIRDKGEEQEGLFFTANKRKLNMNDQKSADERKYYIFSYCDATRSPASVRIAGVTDNWNELTNAVFKAVNGGYIECASGWQKSDAIRRCRNIDELNELIVYGKADEYKDGVFKF